MSEAIVNQITLDCLLNKDLYHTQIKNKKTKQINKEERKFYRKRIFNLFKEMINNNSPEELPQDVKYTYDNFIETAIHYFKTIDNNDIIQSEYKDIMNHSESLQDTSSNIIDVINADKLMMRSIKINDSTLDKYVKIKNTKKKEELILPKQKELNLRSAEFKNKGIKDNITNIYEGNNQKK